MSVPTLSPKQQTSVIVLPVTGATTAVSDAVPYGMYTGSADFLSGAAEQVTYTYRKLGGDVLDIELKEENVYAAYEEAVLEYSYLLNIHQAKNALSDVLGATTGTFNHRGELKSGPLSSSLSGTQVSLKFPKFEFAYARRVSEGMAFEAGFGGNTTIYSASFDTSPDQQDYNLQTLVSQSATGSSPELPYYNKVKDKKILVHKVFYKTPMTMWRFYGYYGGINVVGNLQNYGQYSDDSTFEVIPAWQNKLQAMAYEDHLYTRTSHYSYELKNNILRLFPPPSTASPRKFWIEFSVATDPWESDEGVDIGVNGVNNINTFPVGNIPYENINSIGKQWIRRFALALTKEILGQIRSKFSTIPIPGESVTLNGPALISEGREEQEKLREELKTVLDELTYTKLMTGDAELVEAVNNIEKQIPNLIFVG
jgi:hypothetical protein